MTVRRHPDGTVALEGACPIEDAEALQQALSQVGIKATLDVSDASPYFRSTIGSPSNVKAKGYGLANVELNARATAETVYQIQSMTKQFTATGIMMHLRPTDRIASTHRGHGHCIAKGVDPRAMMKEIYGR